MHVYFWDVFSKTIDNRIRQTKKVCLKIYTLYYCDAFLEFSSKVVLGMYLF